MEILIYILRCLFMLLVTWAAIRSIGKKSIAEMTAYDLAAIILLANIAAEPLVYKIPSKAAIGVFAITLATVFIGWLSLRRFFYNVDNKPSVVVYRGQILDRVLRKNRLNIPLLLSELRAKGYQNLSDIAYAIIEPNGKLSVIPRAEARPLTPKDMNLPVSPVNLSYSLILDGKVNHANLANPLKKDMDWLTKQLEKLNATDPREILIAQIDSSGQMYVVAKDHRERDIPVIQ